MVFGSPQQQVDMHARSKNIYLPYLLNDSQTIHSTINFSKPLLCVTLICCDWSDWSHFYFIMPVMPDKAAFVSVVLLCVQPLPRKQLFLMLQKWLLVAKNEFAFSFKPTRKSSFPRSARTTSGGGNMLMFHVDVNMKRLGIRFKNDSFQWFRVDSFFWETITLYTVHFQI